MDFTPSDRVTELLERVNGFLDEHYYPRERDLIEALDAEVTRDSGKAYPDEVVAIREKAKAEGLWNLFMPDEEIGVGLTNWEYGMLCEVMGRSLVSSMVFNCAAPDVNHLWPLMIHSPSTSSALEWMFVGSEPEVSGSVIEKQLRRWPFSTGSRNFSFCSSVPCW